MNSTFASRHWGKSWKWYVDESVIPHVRVCDDSSNLSCVPIQYTTAHQTQCWNLSFLRYNGNAILHSSWKVLCLSWILRSLPLGITLRCLTLNIIQENSERIAHQHSRMVITFASYSGSPEFKSELRYLLSRPIFQWIFSVPPGN
jgi:hypothetical protein